MSQADTLTDPEAESDVEPTAAEAELPRSFLVRASGPVTKETAVSETVTERDETTMAISRRLETLAEFSTFYDVRSRSGWKAVVIKHLLETEGEDHVEYSFDAGEWDVLADGRVEAYRGVIDVLADPDLDIGATSPSGTKRADVARELADLHVGLVHTDVKSEDRAFETLVEDCHREDLFGPGATIAFLDAKHGAGEPFAGYLERFAEEVRG